jgi:hypothetical protein
MPPVPSVRGERVVRALERAGFKVARVTGNQPVTGLLQGVVTALRLGPVILRAAFMSSHGPEPGRSE